MIIDWESDGHVQLGVAWDNLNIMQLWPWLSVVTVVTDYQWDENHSINGVFLETL